MTWKGKLKEAFERNSDFSEIRSSSFRDIINGNILTKNFIRRQYKFVLLLVLLSIIYIDNRYASERLLSSNLDINRQIQDAKYESLTISAELMEITRQSNIIQMLNEKGVNVKPGKTPPVVIE